MELGSLVPLGQPPESPLTLQGPLFSCCILHQRGHTADGLISQSPRSGTAQHPLHLSPQDESCHFEAPEATTVSRAGDTCSV